MPILCDPEGRTQIDLSATGKVHWLIGRATECDISIPDAGISRFHVTVFGHRDHFYVVDHSLNGTHLCTTDENPSEATRVPTLSQVNTQKRASPSSSAQPIRDISCDTAEINLDDIEPRFRPTDQSSDSGLNKSHAAFRLQEINTRLPRVIGYVPHQYHVPDDIRPLLEMIYSHDGAEALSSMGRTLHGAVQLVLVGNQRHEFVYHP